ncbi:MAG: hypothetical protein HQL88_04775 [Magnetococcales bacterium]|nr:hypothetical protein [Magnetococcales bacterium]
MKPIDWIVPIFALILSQAGPLCAQEESHAGQAVRAAGQASGHASGSAAHSIAASGQVTSAASAVPLAIGGSILGAAGAASTGTAGSAMRAAGMPVGSPLPITDEVVTIMPPNEALRPNSR